MRLIWSHSILNWLYGEAVSYPTPTSLSFFWSFGVMALVCLISQIASGIFLAMHYIPSAELAFSSVEHIMRDVWGGWFLRYLHANGASMFFLVVYLHISRGIYYSSFADKWQFIWYSGVVILFLMIVTAFLGYVLPWGQMSFWAATVITSLASAIPVVGDTIVAWLWGGFSVGEQTLVRFFSLHYLLPFILFALVAAHIVILHETGSSTPTSISLQWGDWITFGPYFFLKDLYYLILFFILFMYFVFFNSNYLGHPDNYIAAMYMSTPAHIVPEWYFLPFYALLRSVPNKLGGVVVMLLSILALALLPVLFNNDFKAYRLNSNYYPQRAIFFSLFVGNAILLGWIGGQPIEEPMYTVGQYSSIFYFFLIFLIFPYINLATYLRESYHVGPQSTATLEFASFFARSFYCLIIQPIKKAIREDWRRLYVSDLTLFKQGQHPAMSSSDPLFEPTEACYRENVIELPRRIFEEQQYLQTVKIFEEKIRKLNYLVKHDKSNFFKRILDSYLDATDLYKNAEERYRLKLIENQRKWDKFLGEPEFLSVGPSITLEALNIVRPDLAAQEIKQRQELREILLESLKIKRKHDELQNLENEICAMWDKVKVDEKLLEAVTGKKKSPVNEEALKIFERKKELLRQLDECMPYRTSGNVFIDLKH